MKQVLAAYDATRKEPMLFFWSLASWTDDWGRKNEDRDSEVENCNRMKEEGNVPIGPDPLMYRAGW